MTWKLQDDIKGKSGKEYIVSTVLIELDEMERDYVKVVDIIRGATGLKTIEKGDNYETLVFHGWDKATNVAIEQSMKHYKTQDEAEIGHKITILEWSER